MATLTKTLDLAGPADAAWSLLADPGAAVRAFPGVLTDSRLDGDIRTVTFAGGMEVREQVVTLDPVARRIAYGVIEGRFNHHSASMQIEPCGPNACRFVWTADFLPNDAAAVIEPLMEQGCAAFRAAVEARVAA